MITRREFIAGGLAGLGSLATLSGGTGCRRSNASARLQNSPGKILGASSSAGHRLRTGDVPPPTEFLKCDAVILGGGIAGLSAARALHRAGITDLLLFELEPSVGGNSSSGQNAVSAYPWGAHYLPLPSLESTEVIQLLEELQLVRGRDAQGLPIYDEYALCADPMERLYVHGAWQEGIVPRLDVSAAERAEITTFLERMEAWRIKVGRDGLRAFAIPVDRSSRDPEFLELDRVTMAAYLDREGWRGESLRWYVNYCCRDDYGAGIDHISAWAGIHYFASRNARAANAPSNAVLTWPEGNGWLAQKIAEPILPLIRARHLVSQVDPQSDGRVWVHVLDLARNITVRVEARGAICALPRFVAQRIVKPWSGQPPLFVGLEYSPWLVANLTLDSLPRSREPLAWDNVLRRSPSLGYVVATHQSLQSHPQATVITYYSPLDALPTKEAREKALAKTHADWCREIVADLQTAHPEIGEQIRQIDLCLWGHAMIRPVPGFIWSDTRRRMQQPLGHLHFAHSDMSGISIFEEAYTHGIRAAAELLNQLRAPSPT